MPRLWRKTIEDHRREVHDAVLDTTAALVEQHGLHSVTMSRIAETTGIGRATLYKYFPDLQAILLAWHERQIAVHMAELAHARDRGDSPGERLEAVLTSYALRTRRSRGHHDRELAALLHNDDEVLRATQQLHGMLQELIEEGARAGDLRRDVPAGELANYCLHALAGSGNLGSDAAVHRLVDVTRTGLRPPA